jgi:HlyD family secretion protein
MNILGKKYHIKFVLVCMILLFGIGCTLFGNHKEKYLTLNGTIEVDDILVGSKIGGRVTEVLVQEGEVVKKGDVLARIDDAELLTKKEQDISIINQEKENVSQHAAYLELVQSGNRTQEIQRSKADVDAIKVKLDLAVKDAGRYEKLYKEGAVSQQTRDSAVNQVDVLKAQVKSSQETYSLQKAGFRKEDIDQARDNWISAKASLQQAQHDLDEIETQLEEMTVVAPMDAVVEVCDLRVGDLLGPNQSAMTLVIPNKLWVRVYAPENYLGFLKENSKVNVKVDSFPNEIFNGIVEQINRKAEFTPKNVQTAEERIDTVFGVKVRLDDATRRLRAGMSADVTFPDIRLIK